MLFSLRGSTGGATVDFDPPRCVLLSRPRGSVVPCEESEYRAVLEALRNIVKHARARYFSVILERRDDHAVAIVEDDGAGFDA